MGVISVVLADDYHPVRAATRDFLHLSPDIRVVAEVCNGAEALEAVHRLRPDVLILDMRMPVLDGAGVLRQLHHERWPVKVLVLSGYDGKEFVSGIFADGATGFLNKDEAAEKLIEAVHRVSKGVKTYYGTWGTGRLSLSGSMSPA